MKRAMTLLAVTMIAASAAGCSCVRCCPWLYRGAFCGSSTTYAAAPVPMAAPVAPAPQFVAPQYSYADPAPMMFEQSCGTPMVTQMGCGSPCGCSQCPCEPACSYPDDAFSMPSAPMYVDPSPAP
jgi:hypothetical protein